MNARIQELALEAFDPINAMASEGVADRHTFDQAWFQLYSKKFAELIVQECGTVINSENYRQHSKGWSDAIEWADGMIKEHFGVEE